jgi:hypothetical protein
MAKFAASGDPEDLDPRIGFHRRRDRLIAEIIGMFRLSLCDGVISEAEARAMHEWVLANPDTSFIYPVKQLKERLDRAFSDSVLDPDEQQELLEFGKKFQPDADAHHPAPSATKLPLDDPEAPLTFEQQQCLHWNFRERNSEVVRGTGACARWHLQEQGSADDECSCNRRPCEPELDSKHTRTED